MFPDCRTIVSNTYSKYLIVFHSMCPSPKVIFQIYKVKP